MRFQVDVNGFHNNLNIDCMFPNPKKLTVWYTSDQFGKNLSIGDLEDGTQLTIPFDQILKMINK